jgi:CheY-like chemotaxis protein
MAELRWILLVEDEEDHRLLVAQALRRMGSTIPLLEVESGEKALEWMRHQTARGRSLDAGLVILDLGLPGISGFGVLQQMREVPELAHTPVVVITASQNNMDQDHAFNLGVKGFFQKPADFRDYQEILGRVLALSREASEDPPAQASPPAPPAAPLPPLGRDEGPIVDRSDGASDRMMVFGRRPRDTQAGSE